MKDINNARNIKRKTRRYDKIQITNSIEIILLT